MRTALASVVVVALLSPLAMAGWPMALEGRAASQFRCVVFSPDGKRVAASNLDGRIRIWDADSGKQLRTVEHGQPIHHIAYVNAGKEILGVSYDGVGEKSVPALFLWDAETGKANHKWLQSTGPIVVLPNGKSFVCVGGAGYKEIEQWDLAGKTKKTALKGHTGRPKAIAVSPDGKTVVSGGGEEEVRFWDLPTAKQFVAVRPFADAVGSRPFGPFGVAAMSYSPDGDYLATSAIVTSVKIWDARKRKEYMSLQPGEDRPTIQVHCLEFAPDGERLAVGNYNTLELWSWADKRVVARFEHDKTVTCLAFRSDGKWLASGDHVIRLWNVPPLPKKD
jgi:WD40 repeat protein